MQKNKIPKVVSKTVWYIDPKKLDLQKNSGTIIKQVLFFGDTDALAWIFFFYGKDEVAKVAQNIPLGAWNKKSLALWKLYLGISPKTREEQMNEKGKING